MLVTRVLGELSIEDEASFTHVGLYGDLKAYLARAGYKFSVPSAEAAWVGWDRVAFLNLTFWNADAESDVLVSESIPADVITHVAWHRLARESLPGGAPAHLFLGESVASAFDLYLVGRLLGHAPDSAFLESQVPAMASACQAAGLTDEEFSALLAGVAADPERAFEDLRELLFEASLAVFGCRTAAEAASKLDGFSAHPFIALLHHYELSNWVLYARAYAQGDGAQAQSVHDVLRSEGSGALAWLERAWLRPALEKAEKR